MAPSAIPIAERGVAGLRRRTREQRDRQHAAALRELDERGRGRLQEPEPDRAGWNRDRWVRPADARHHDDHREDRADRGRHQDRDRGAVDSGERVEHEHRDDQDGVLQRIPDGPGAGDAETQGELEQEARAHVQRERAEHERAFEGRNVFRADRRGDDRREPDHRQLRGSPSRQPSADGAGERDALVGRGGGNEAGHQRRAAQGQRQ